MMMNDMNNSISDYQPSYGPVAGANYGINRRIVQNKNIRVKGFSQGKKFDDFSKMSIGGFESRDGRDDLDEDQCVVNNWTDEF